MNTNPVAAEQTNVTAEKSTLIDTELGLQVFLADIFCDLIAGLNIKGSIDFFDKGLVVNVESNMGILPGIVTNRKFKVVAFLPGLNVYFSVAITDNTIYARRDYLDTSESLSVRQRDSFAIRAEDPDSVTGILVDWCANSIMNLQEKVSNGLIAPPH